MAEELMQVGVSVEEKFKGANDIEIIYLEINNCTNQTQICSLYNCKLNYFYENDTKTLEFSDLKDSKFRLKNFKYECDKKHADINITDLDQTAFELELTFKSKTECAAFGTWLKSKKTIEDPKLVKLIEDSFKTNLKINPKIGFDCSTYLMEKVKTLMKTYNEITYHGPYTTLCQSSGFGKSRACASLVQKEFYVVYCCLRSEESSGYPYRSCLADKFFLVKNPDIKNYFICYFNAFIELLNKPNSIGCNEFYEKYDQQNSKSEAKQLVDKKVESFKNDEKISEYTGIKPLIFVFDESSSLLKIKTNGYSHFFVLRSLLSKLKGRVFVLFLDTFTHLSEFMPLRYADPSERIAIKGLSTMDPIYLLPNWDVFANNDVILNMDDTIKFENVSMFGRVLWGSWLDTKRRSPEVFQDIESNKLYSLAVRKLIGGKDPNSSLDLNDCLAILSSRVCAIKPKCLSTSQSLVAKNMAVCLFVNSERNIFEIDYPSEPILADVAAFYMNDIKTYDYFVENLINAIESSIVDQGEKGELIAKLILLNAKDKCMNPSNPLSILKYTFLTTVGEFIQSIYGKCGDRCGSIQNDWKCNEKKQDCCIDMIQKQLKNPNELLNGLINFSHFAKPREMIPEINLEKFLKRCAAVHCRSCQEGIDFVIPVCLKRGNLKSMTAIMVQVKLWLNTSKPSFESAFKFLDKTDWNKCWDQRNPVLLLFMQIGSTKTNQKTFKNNPKPIYSVDNRAMIYSQGLSRSIFTQLSEELESKLKTFLYKDPDPHKNNSMDKYAYQSIHYCLD